MGVAWIDNIYNNSDTMYYLKSVDDRNNGALSGGGTGFTLDDKSFHPLKPKTHYKADWCGIPWYFQGDHYKALSVNQKSGVHFYTSEIGNKNWIMFENPDNGHQLARQAAPMGSDFHCTLRIENDGIHFDIVNNNSFSGENAVYQVLSETKEWLQVAAPIIADAVKAVAE